MRFRARFSHIAAAVLLTASVTEARSASSDAVLADRKLLEVPGCNATSWWQIPDQKDLFVGRVLRDANVKTACPVNDAWALVWGKMDWANNRVVSKGRVFDLPLKISNEFGKFTITTAYDPAVMIYRGERWLAFECHGRNFRGSVAICMSPLDLERGIDRNRLYIAVEGVSYIKDDEAHASASVPKLLSYDNRAFIYWTSVRIRKSDNVWLGLTVKGIELVPTPDNKLIAPKGFGQRMPSNHPLALEVMGPEPGGRQADAYEVRKVGSAFYLLGSSSNCLVPLAPISDCYRLTIRKSNDPLGHHIFNEVRISSTDLPPNPVQYMHLMETPTGQMRMIGHVLPMKNNVRAEPTGFYNYSIDLGVLSAYRSATDASKQLLVFVQNAYRVFLGREADQSGLRSHTAALENGADRHSVLSGLLLSPESRKKFGWERMSDEDFVRFMYQRILGRDADPGGISLWTNAIGSGKLTRELAMKRFLDTEEFAVRRPELQ